MMDFMTALNEIKPMALTKREFIAAIVLATTAKSPPVAQATMVLRCQTAVMYADMLLEELNRNSGVGK